MIWGHDLRSIISICSLLMGAYLPRVECPDHLASFCIPHSDVLVIASTDEATAVVAECDISYTLGGSWSTTMTTYPMYET